jgi:hypothetical protein
MNFLAINFPAFFGFKFRTRFQGRIYSVANMSGTQFYNLLQELGYASKTKVRPESFDWMFITEEATKPLLSWICNNIKRNNLVTDEELKKLVELGLRFKKLSNPIIYSDSLLCKLKNKFWT